MSLRGQGWLGRGVRSSVRRAASALAMSGLFVAGVAWSAGPDAGAASAASGSGGGSSNIADASVEPGTPAPDVVAQAFGATDAAAQALLANQQSLADSAPRGLTHNLGKPLLSAFGSRATPADSLPRVAMAASRSAIAGGNSANAISGGGSASYPLSGMLTTIGPDNSVHNFEGVSS